MPRLPSGGELAHAILGEEEAETKRRAPLPDRSDLAKVTQFLTVTHEDSVWAKSRIAGRINSAPNPDFGASNEPHFALAGLPLPVYLTTNYDDTMTLALRARGRHGKQEVCRWNQDLLEDVESAFDQGYEPTPEIPVVYHLHGVAGKCETLVASEDDYVDFLVNLSKDIGSSPGGVKGKPILPLRIRRALKNSTLLFIGYGLSDVNFRVILRGLVGSLEPCNRQVHITVQYPHDGNGATELHDYLEKYFRWTLDLTVFWGSAKQFSLELVRRWEQRQNSQAAAR